MSSNALSVSRPTTAEASVGASFVAAVAICLLVVSMPVKNLGYIAPLLFIAFQFIVGNFDFLKRAFLLTSLLLGVSIISMFVDSLAGQRVNIPALFFGVITYASLIVMTSFRSDFALHSEQRRYLTNIISWWVIVQSVVGIMQFVMSRNPDAVCGTLGLFDFLNNSITIAQVYFTFNVFAMVLFLLTDARRLLAKIAIVIGLLACALAHSGHQSLFLMAALGLVGLLQMRLRGAIAVGGILLVLVALTFTVSTIKWSDAIEWQEKVLDNEASPKRMATLAGLDLMSSPKNLLLGVGIGQFGSRAALIASGDYLSTPLPRPMTGQSDYYRESILPGLYEHMDHGEGSAISKPYYSALNLVVEFGLPLTMMMFTGAIWQFARNRRLSLEHDSHARTVGIMCNVGLVFFMLCCLIENYIEFPQAIFVPSLLYFAAQATVRTDIPIKAMNGLPNS